MHIPLVFTLDPSPSIAKHFLRFRPHGTIRSHLLRHAPRPRRALAAPAAPSLTRARSTRTSSTTTRSGSGGEKGASLRRAASSPVLDRAPFAVGGSFAE